MFELESILDSPREGLDQQVWRRCDDGTFCLTDTAEAKIQRVVDWVRSAFGLDDVSVNVTGSITSNQFANDADIDVHFFHPSFRRRSEDMMVDMNKILRHEFELKFTNGTGDGKIGEHPIEVYFQQNPYQDLMSVGCYDFSKKIWLVGPDMKPMDYDPYSEFYADDMEYIKDVIRDIRNVILECYETAMVIRNSKNQEFKNQEFQNLKELIERGTRIFESAKQCRKVYSSPVSVEDALEKRDSKKWKIADSAFKLMDRFGYLKALKNFQKIGEGMEDGQADDIADLVVLGIGSSIKINESVDESISSLGKYMLLASFLAIPGLLPQNDVARGLQNVNKAEMKMDSPAVQKQIRTAAKDQQTYGGYYATDIVNIIARTLYAEGAGEGADGRRAILSVILNRSGGKRNAIVPVIREREAFSCWNKMTSDEWSNFIYSIPKSVLDNKRNKTIWGDCVDLAVQLFNGTFKSTIGNRNMFINPKKASQKARNSWGKDMDLQVGNHKFGYGREHDPKFKTSAQAKTQTTTTSGTYVVKNGDTLAKIAKSNNMSLNDLMKKNPQIQDPNKIKVGQKVNV